MWNRNKQFTAEMFKVAEKKARLDAGAQRKPGHKEGQHMSYEDRVLLICWRSAALIGLALTRPKRFVLTERFVFCNGLDPGTKTTPSIFQR
jgi:hypothetical protein